MIVDLLRNDLGRIAEFGSTRVKALFELERFETLWQLTSTVTAHPRADVDVLAVLRALFPCGSVTGAPKASTMAIIAELEHQPRGLYCGAIGVLGPPRSSLRAHFSVAIRTLVIDHENHAARYGTGGAITWDSATSAEHAELMAKAAILSRSVAPFQLLETMAYLGRGFIANEEAHLARLRGSAVYFGFDYHAEKVRAALRQALRNTSASRAAVARSRRSRVMP